MTKRKTFFISWILGIIAAGLTYELAPDLVVRTALIVGFTFTFHYIIDGVFND